MFPTNCVVRHTEGPRPGCRFKQDSQRPGHGDQVGNGAAGYVTYTSIRRTYRHCSHHSRPASAALKLCPAKGYLGSGSRAVGRHSSQLSVCHLRSVGRMAAKRQALLGRARKWRCIHHCRDMLPILYSSPARALHFRTTQVILC